MTIDYGYTSTALTPFVKALLPVYFQIWHRGTKIEIVEDGIATLRKLHGKRTVICLNHPNVDDGDIIFAISKMSGEDFYFLTAREIIYGCTPYHQLLQYLGCLPVDRGQSNVDTFIAARDLLVERSAKLVVFPEGEISNRNDALLPLKTGAVRISFSALQKLRSRGDLSPVYLLPIAIKYTYATNIVDELKESLCQLERYFGIERGPESYVSLHDRICELADLWLHEVEREYSLPVQQKSSRDGRLDRIHREVISRASDALQTPFPDGQSRIDQVHRLQSALFNQRLTLRNPAEELSPDEIRRRQEQLSIVEDELNRDLRFLSVYDGYLTDTSSQEKYADVISVLERQFFGHASPRGPRRIYIEIGEAMDLSEQFEEFGKDKRGVVDSITNALADHLGRMLAHLDELREPIFVIPES